MLSGSLRALDGAVLQHTLGKLNEEERERERRGGRGAALGRPNGRRAPVGCKVPLLPMARNFARAPRAALTTASPFTTRHPQCTKRGAWARRGRSSGGRRAGALRCSWPPCGSSPAAPARRRRASGSGQRRLATRRTRADDERAGATAAKRVHLNCAVTVSALRCVWVPPAFAQRQRRCKNAKTAAVLATGLPHGAASSAPLPAAPHGRRRRRR